MHNTESYVWYAGYGSNLNKQRFLCYIKGEKPKYSVGTTDNKGCTNKDSPIEDKPCNIPHRLYFALPDGKTKTKNWGLGGVAFITPDREKNKEHWTKVRMWKITREQYCEVRIQEGCCWYNYEICLGEEKGIPIYTITNKNNLKNIRRPSDAYLKTIISGLKEIENLTDKLVAKYLMEKDGIKNLLKRDELKDLIESTIDC